MTTITTAKLREMAYYMNTTMHDIRALAVSRGVTIDDTPADTEEHGVGTMTITQEQYDAAVAAYMSAPMGKGMGVFVAAPGITIAPAEPPEAMVRLAWGFARNAWMAAQSDPSRAAKIAALAVLQHVQHEAKRLTGPFKDYGPSVQYVRLRDVLAIVGAA